MIDRLKERAQKEKAVQDLLSGRDTSSMEGISSTGDTLGTARAALGGTVQDMMGGAVAKYGLDPSIAKTGMEGSALADTKLARQQEEILSKRKLDEKRANLNRLYEFAYDKMISAGKSLEEADAFAREWALTQIQQDFTASEAEKDRASATEKSNIKQRYAEQTAGLEVDEGDPYAQALARTSMGLIGTLGTGYALGAFKKKPQVSVSKTNTGITSPAETNLYDYNKLYNSSTMGG